MLDQKTKNKIDSLRGVLVGKIPDPKAQVDQITTALIYKFMDDMDMESKKLGGKPSYFTGIYKKFSWSKIMDKTLSGQDRFYLYEEAIRLLPNNENLPNIFRTVFKDAVLPYRDLETLNLFLKEINEFQYNHSEDLGNAFEYLLSILGSQGKAGQFRTPRHIIDFIVAVVNPKKDESILDPACGTAGFLISAYKHILKQNSQNYDLKKVTHTFSNQKDDAFSVQTQDNGLYKGENLNPDEKTKLQKSIIGYDIAPDMVKLSMVNMYLHRFVAPQIYEYDTLTHDSRWEENFDVILANPPFMTPTGGIRPHDRFSVASNRSEVLFVDYIAEHLNINGRAGIVVPEGIIFKNDKAYKSLRRMLVDDLYLWAVVSLPAGIFKPYSGVKTSILFLDRKLAKTNADILFVGVQNDGFSLGATRQKIEENDLKEAFETLQAYIQGEEFQSNKALLVKKKKIAEDGNYDLSSNRYEIYKSVDNSFPFVSLGDKSLFDIISGGTPSTQESVYWNGKIPWVTIADLNKNKIGYIFKTKKAITREGLLKSAAKILPINSILVSSRATIGVIAINKIPLATNQGFKNIVIKNQSRILPKFLAYTLTTKINEMKDKAVGATYGEVSKTAFQSIRIPSPPLEIQQKIVAEIDSYQKIIDGAQQIIDNWKPVIDIDPNWSLIVLGDYINTITPPKKISKTNFAAKGVYPIVDQSQTEIAGYTNDNYAVLRIPRPLIIFGDHTCVVKYIDKPFAQGSDGIKIIETSKKIEPKFLYFYLKCQPLQIEGYKRHFTTLKNYNIPLPPLKIQKRIVQDIEKDKHTIEACRLLIETKKLRIKQCINNIYQ